jgi:hypothetical protein
MNDIPLRGSGESLVAHRLRTFPDRVLAARPGDPLARRFVDQLNPVEAFVLFYAGYIEGLWNGAQEHLVAWRKDLDGTLAGLVKLLTDEATRVKIGKTIEIGIATSLWEFFARPLTDPQASELRGISPAASDAVGQLEIIQSLQPLFGALAVFETKAKTEGFLATLGDFADSLVAALIDSAADDLRKLLLANGPEEQGAYVGHFLGAGIVEIIRTIVEPPEVSVVEFVALLSLDATEQQYLGIGQ